MEYKTVIIMERVLKLVGQFVFLTNTNDLGMMGDPIRKFISDKTKLKLLRINRKGMAIVEDSDKNIYSVYPSSIEDYNYVNN